MLVRLRDFAEANRVSQRTVQICIKENYGELGEHIDRRGKQGTWLDEFAVQFILERIKLPSKDEVLLPTAREAALMAQLVEANRLRAEAEQRAAVNAEAAGKLEAAQKETKLLESFIQDAKTEIGVLNDEKRDLSIEIGKLTQRATQAEENAQNANTEAWRQYRIALEIYNDLPWWKKRRRSAPVPPNEQGVNDEKE